MLFEDLATNNSFSELAVLTLYRQNHVLSSMSHEKSIRDTGPPASVSV
jgi:hypothetical protein